MNQKKIGILLSYVNLAVGMIVNIFLTPYLIYIFGDKDYSVYKVMQSFAGPLSMFHFGIATIVTRCIVHCENSNMDAKKEKENTLALALIASIVMVVFIVIASITMYHTIPSMYSNAYDYVDIAKGQKIFLCFVCATVLHMLTDVFSGCIIGHEKYVLNSGIQLFKTTFKLILIVSFLKSGFGIVSVAFVDLLLSLSILLISGLFTIFKLKEKPYLHHFDKQQMIEIVLFGSALLLQAFVNQVNNNVDTMILGVYIEEKSIITMYSSALTIYAIYNSLISVVTSYFLPNATKLIMNKASGRQLTDFIIKPGRYQAMIAVACICGFALCGKDFICIWIGEKYIDAYTIILMLMIPVTIPLVENAAISILDASLKRIYRSVVLAIMAVINIVLSLVLVQKLGFWGASLGTVISLIIGHAILMNIYYAKVFEIEIIRMFGSIFKGILPAGIITLMIEYPLVKNIDTSLSGFILKCILFILIYSILLWLFGINKSEKQTINNMIRRKHNETEEHGRY